MDEGINSAESINKLREAMHKLQAYSMEQSESTTSSVSKIISLVHDALFHPFESKPKKHQHQQRSPNKSEIFIAIELINRNRLFIEKLKEGTPAEQEFAEEFTQTITTYNESCDRRIQGYVSNRERLAKFFSNDKQGSLELPKIALPKKVPVKYLYPEQRFPERTHHLSCKAGVAVPISRQSTELFQMKAISLLERYGITSKEARVFVKQSPIHVSAQENEAVCTLTQTLSLFPGQTIVVMGTSALDPKTHAISQLFPETFCLSLESTQTGFPHPLQRAGWTVASQLIPDFPQRIDLLKETAEIFHRRSLAIAGLSPEGKFLKHAKHVLSLKKKVFCKHAEELIALHKKLSLVIYEQSCATLSANAIIEAFYKLLSTHPAPFDFFSETSHLIREAFIIRPHQQLIDGIIKGKSTDFGSNVEKARYLAAENFLKQAIDLAKAGVQQQSEDIKLLNEKIKFDYIECFGDVIGKAASQIFLQYLSEDLIFSPPTLSAFEQKVQTIAYRHLKDFLDELSLPLTGNQASDEELIYHLLKDQILADISIFQEEKPSSIPKELLEYFKDRYASLSPV